MAVTKAFLLMFMLLVCVALISTETAAARSLLGEKGEVVVKDKHIGYGALDPSPGNPYHRGNPYSRPCNNIYCESRPPAP